MNAIKKITLSNALKQLLVGSTLVIASLLHAASALAADTPVGTWETIDDKTGQPKSLVEISADSNGVLSGKIVKGLGPTADPERRCTACKDANKDQLIRGMTIISGLKKDDDEWNGGTVLDPESGKTYKCKMYLEDNGQKLVVRGYIGFALVGRSQTWNRQQ
mgnify:CR=1 FL=1